MGDLYRRTPGVRIIVRDPGAIQFGFDATRAGLIEVADAAAVARALRQLDGSVSRERFVYQLRAAGVGDGAPSLVDELVSFGLWQPLRPPDAIYVLGMSPLALQVCDALRADGFRVRRPRLGELTAHYVQRIDPDVPVLCIDEDRHMAMLARIIRSMPSTWLPVTTFDTRVLLGPFHTHGKGPCPLCFSLHRTDADPHWVTVTDQRHPTDSLDSLVALAGVAHIVAAARHLVGRPGLPGATPVRWMPGEVREIDVFSRTHQQFLEPHARCPACFQAEA